MPRQERERRYIAEYMKESFPEGNWQLNVELGPIPAEYVTRYGVTRAAALFRPTRPRVDAVKWGTNTYYIIEAKIYNLKAGIGDLTYYKSVLSVTPDLPYYQGQTIRARLVVPWMLDWLVPVASAVGIEVIVYPKDWVEDYVHERQNYFTAEYRERRARIMKDRAALGLD